MEEIIFQVIMTCVIDGGSDIYEGFPNKKEAETFVKDSKQIDKKYEHESLFVYAIQPAVA